MLVTRIWTLGLTALALAGVTACGSSGGGGGTESLSAPGTVSLVTADDSGTEPNGSGGGLNVGAGVLPPNADYFTDSTSVHVYDPSMEILQTINTILCYVDMTAYDEMLNQGLYKAQTDVSLCESDSSSGDTEGGSGQSVNDQAEEFQLFTVNSSRASRNVPQTVDCWVPQTDEDGLRTIRAHTEIESSATREDPFGSFHIDFASVAEGGSVTDPYLYGALGTVDLPGNDGFQLFEEVGDVDAPHDTPGDFSYQQSVTLQMDPGGEAGVAKIRADLRLNFGLGDSGLLTDEWKVAYNPTHFKRQLGSDAEVTLSRTEFKNAAWRYNLYYTDGDEPGARVELNSGFPFRTETDDYGWMGYWGLWTPEEVTVLDGDTIYKHDFETGNDVPYTMHKAPGKLIRHTREFLPLTDLVGHTFHWWNDLDHAVYLVDYAAGFFNKIAQLDEDKHVWIPIEPPIAIDVGDEGGYLHMWSNSFGGTVSYVDGDDDVTYFEEQLVNGSSSIFDDAVDGMVTLHGFVQCLDSELTGEDADHGAVYLPDKADVSTSHVFSFDQDDLTLRHDVNGDGSLLQQVGLADGEAPTMGPNMWGMRSGPMVLDTTGLTNPWDVWLVDVFYTYETGHNEWNGHATVVDALDEHVAFDAPIQFLYTHTETNDLNEDPTYDGQKYFLSYGGPGDLWGIPYEGVDLTGDTEFDRYYPVFSIASGTLMGPLGDEYVLRPVEIEQTLQVDESGSAALDLTPAEALVLPDSTLYTLPDIGDRPSVAGPPAVVNGRVVRSN